MVIYYISQSLDVLAVAAWTSSVLHRLASLVDDHSFKELVMAQAKSDQTTQTQHLDAATIQ